VLALVLLAGLALSSLPVACGGEPPAVAGTQWRLAWWPVDGLDPREFTITLRFEDGRLGGTAAVNSYGGPYALAADGGFRVGDLAVTGMAGPPRAMRAEAAYLRLLRAARVLLLSADGGELVLRDGGGRDLLRFVPVR